MKCLPVLFILFAGSAMAESSTLFETQFATLPEGWNNSNWNTSITMGAWIDEYLNTGAPWSFTADMGSGADPASWYFVPDGTDSLLIHIEHDFYAYASASNSEAYIELMNPTGVNQYLFYQNINGVYYGTTDPIDIVVTPTPAGHWIGLRIYARIAFSYPATASIEWYITNLSVTAIGNELALDNITWGNIKQTFQ